MSASTLFITWDLTFAFFFLGEIHLDFVPSLEDDRYSFGPNYITVKG